MHVLARMPKVSYPWLLLALWSCTPDPTDLLPTLPRLVAEQDRLDLGEANPGQPLRASAVFSNTGEAPVHLTAHVEPQDGPFAITAREEMVPAGEQVVIEVEFVAFDPGLHARASLVVEHDAQPNQHGLRTLTVELLARTAPLPDCNDHNPCTLDSVDPTNTRQCVHQPVHGPCDDRSACTVDDRCEEGQCTGTPLSCDDNLPCTADGCDATRGCEHQPTDSWCQGDNPCIVGRCMPGIGADSQGCVQQVAANGTLCGTPTCAALPLCVESACTRMIAPDGYPCEDGNPCSSGDSCQHGICQAGTVVTGSANPVLVRDVQTHEPVDPGTGTGAAERPLTQDAPLFGQWVVSVDGLALSAVAQSPRALVLWRGAQGSMPGVCFMRPGHCGDLPLPTEGPPSTKVALNLTVATLDGVATSNHQLNTDQAFQFAMPQPLQQACHGAPPGVVAAVAGASRDHMVAGAAILRFPGACAVPDDVDYFQPRGEAVTTLLVVFVGWNAQLVIRDAVWLGTSDKSPLVMGRNGDPLLAVDLTDRWLSVVYATPGTLDTCIHGSPTNCEQDQECPTACTDQMVLHLRNYDPLGAAVGLVFGPEWQQEVQVSSWHGGVLDEVGELLVYREESTATVLWTQHSPPFTGSTPTCILPQGVNHPQTMGSWDAMSQLMVEGGTQMGAMQVASGVSTIGHGFDEQGLVQIAWSRLGEVDGQCTVVDRMVQRRPPVESELLYESIGNNSHYITATRVQSADGDVHVLATWVDGWVQWMTPSANHGDPTFQHVGWPSGSDAMMFPGAAPLLVKRDHVAVLASLAQVGIYRNSYPTPALALTQPNTCSPHGAPQVPQPP